MHVLLNGVKKKLGGLLLLVSDALNVLLKGLDIFGPDGADAHLLTFGNEVK